MDLKQLANDEDSQSFSNRMRARRFALFEGLAGALNPPIRILDVGGTNDFWRQRGWAGRPDVQIITINIHAEPQEFHNIEPRVGDATNLSEFADGSFDIAFSNSVIEHLFTFDNQMAMASEMMRVGRNIWVQTPNFWFPMEPHFHFLGWQWMPLWTRVEIIRRRNCGWRGKTPNREAAKRLVGEVRLLCASELRKLFPGAQLVPERFFGLVKSWMVVKGFNSHAGGECNSTFSTPRAETPVTES